MATTEEVGFNQGKAEFETNIINGNKTIEIKNFIGEKIVRKIEAREGVTVQKEEKDID